MQNDITELYQIFKKIKNEGWVETKREGFSGIGYTFESLIGKEEETFPIPDYGSVEIKTIRENSRKIIHLFSIVPDGDFLFPMKRVVDILGYPDKKNKNCRVFNMGFKATNWTDIGYYRKAKIFVDRKKEKIDLVACDIFLNNLHVDTSWSFKLLEERINLKLKELAVVKAKSKKIRGKEYFFYDKVSFYEFKDFKTFLSLVEEGVITISFSISVHRQGKYKGKINDRATNFSIKEIDIEKMFNRIPLDF